MRSNLSIIIPTYNAELYIVPLLRKLEEQTFRPFEIVIVDSSSTDDTVKLARNTVEFNKLKIITIPKEEFDHGGTRSEAGKIAIGEILVFLTQDSLPFDKYTIESIVRPILDDDKIGATFGRQIPYESTNLFGKHLRYFNYPNESYVREYSDKIRYGIKTIFLSNSFGAYKREALEKVGWFKNNLILGEDSYIGAKLLKAGYKIAYVSEAKVYHSHSYTIWQEFKRYFDIGVFHKCENWILEEFGKAQKEGWRYFMSEFRFLLENKSYHLLPEFILRNFLKFMGYNFGYHYDKIPRNVVKNLSMHFSWWDKLKR